MLQQTSVQRTFSAFISYSRRDESHAEWLQARLETYRLPRRLVPNPLVPGARPDRLAPVFRDRSTLSAAPDLEQSLAQALAASGHLIVICTPAAAQSDWVNREIEMFHAARRGAHILPALFDGDEHCAFPPALRHNDDGSTITPLAADFRATGDGPRLALLKLIAELAGVPLGELIGRDDRRRHRRLAALAGAAMSGMTVFAGISAYALAAKAEAERERQRSEAIVQRLVTDLRAAAGPIGSLPLLEKVNDAALTYFRGQSIESMSDTARQQRAMLLIAMGQDDTDRGDFASAMIQFEEAHRTTAARLQAQPLDSQRLFDHAQSEFWLGNTAMMMGDDRKARAHFEHYARMAESLVARDPANPEWQMEAGYAAVNQGTVVLRQEGEAEAAAGLFVTGLRHFQRAQPLMKDRKLVQLQISDANAWIADAKKAAGDPEAAIRFRLAQLDILKTLAAESPADVDLKRRQVSASLAMGRLYRDLGRAGEAVEQLRAVHRAAVVQAAADPENGTARRQARMTALFLAQAELELPAAQRPPLSAIDARIGSCDLDDLDGGAEVGSFCRLTRASWLYRRGERAEGRALAASATAAMRARGGQLSDLWGIDFERESRRLEEGEARA